MAVVRANYVKRNANERATAKANTRYIQERPGRDKEKLTRALFGAAGFLGRYEAYQFIKDAPEGTYFYRLKLSPDPSGEDTRRDLNMQKLTRTMMRRLEKRLNTAIPWAAALHDDHTDIRHVHILAAIPRTLNKYELEFLIREATQTCLVQRRALDRGVERLPWQQKTPPQTLKIGKYPTFSNHLSRYAASVHGAAAQAHSCTCPRCHFPQVHDRRGSHSCPSCGFLLHKKKAPTFQRGKGVEWERSH